MGNGSSSLIQRLVAPKTATILNAQAMSEFRGALRRVPE